jgi:hypothetical protein
MGERQQSHGAYPWPIEPSVLMSYDTSALENFLIAFCKRPPSGMKVRSSGRRSNTVLKVTSSHMVRFGGDTTRDGALNQQKAYEVLDPSIIKVPRVLHYFERNRGYLLMEYFDGEVSETLDKSQIGHVVHALGHMAITRGEGPASLCGGDYRVSYSKIQT